MSDGAEETTVKYDASAGALFWSCGHPLQNHTREEAIICHRSQRLVPHQEGEASASPPSYHHHPRLVVSFDGKELAVTTYDQPTKVSMSPHRALQIAAELINYAQLILGTNARKT